MSSRRARNSLYLVHDLCVLCLTLLAALYLRHGFPLIQEGDPDDIYLLLAVTFGAAILVLPLMHTHRSMWRFTSSAELLHIMIAVALVIALSDGLLFLTRRLEMVPRSLPLIHWALAVLGMSTSRLLARTLFGPAPLCNRHSSLKQHVLVIGTGHTAELYLRFIKRIVQHEVVVEGLVDSDANLTGRLFQRHPILGTVLEVPAILAQLRVHGITVTQLVLAQLFENLTPAEQQLLTDIQTSERIELLHFGKHMGAPLQPKRQHTEDDFYYQISNLSSEHYIKLKGVYPHLKRLGDVALALVLLVLAAPLLLVTALLVWLDVGSPLLFWQQRPGQFGKPFRLYKFRTMRNGGRGSDEDRLAHKSGDESRTSTLGKWLRRLRLDELPQLFHILTGTMAFVGPRPLLPEDQPARGELRLSVRPGVTGFAQIHGGDALSPTDKLLLDVWYIRHLSLWLDLSILLRTILVVFQRDTRKAGVIEQIQKSQSAYEPV